MTLDLSRMDAMAQAELVASGSLSALELVDAAIARIESLEPKVHALASTDFDSARARARSGPSGAFGGVPLLVKDLLAVPGQRWEMGSRLFRGNVATEGSPFSARLEAAGLVLLGKTTTSEFGLLGSTETRVAGVTRNPWDLERSATGSSGGSAAAVAAGMVPLAHASDGGGSIRIPASACGVFGLKPSRGRCVPAGPSDMNGLLIEHAVSRTVRDSARMLSLLEHTDGPLAPVGFVAGPSSRRLRIGYYATTLMGAAPEAGASSVLERTVELCRALGHELVAVEPPPIDGQAISDGFFTLAGSGIAQIAAMMDGLLGRPPGDAELEPFTLALLDWYRSLSAESLPAALVSLERQGDAMRRYLDAYDVVLCPTMPVEPPRLGFLAPDLDRLALLRRTESLAGYTPIHNVAGVPAMSVPLFRTEAGLPIGSHFAAPVGHEVTLLALAYELEAAAPWVDTYPRL